MRPFTGPLLVLFLLANVVIASDVFRSDGIFSGALEHLSPTARDSFWIGLELAQIQIVTIAYVFFPRRRWALLGLLAVTLFYWSGAGPHDDSPFRSEVLEVGLMPLLAFTLAVALCCGGARLRGWRVAEIDDPRSPNRGQFSLGTLVLAMTVAAVFLGMARLMRADIFDWATALVVVLLAAIGTSFFLAIVRQRPAEAIAFTLAASG
ncbi:MAG: hypothetical protein KDA41_01170, partial [Planctomycetales bacterium]|nr:hypothetical protein [Planctomycetales bacterium]